MSDKEGYFPPNTSQKTIDDTLYTDYGTYNEYEALESDLKALDNQKGEDNEWCRCDGWMHFDAF